MKTVGDRVESLRLMTPDPITGGVPIKYADLARLVGMPVNSLQTLVSVPQDSSKYLARLANYFRVNALWLETGTGPKHVPVTNLTDTCRGSLNPAILHDAELTIGAAEHLAQRKFGLTERCEWLARVYEQLVRDGGKLTAEHQAAIFEDAKQGKLNAGKQGKN
ncbi:hypothetical protein [Dyella caseinilytica]|uniref:Bacteriophage CI repressor-like protein n=1 Tax=Dyella caseinilytica TaxID=1849581 RepID=A0ABX7GPT9_9GAMM|nr:hypothetical protein [Dyella caseinilytica]QRN52418.1 hypothetical protein ISN74_13125 [Dyella caseinilytica]GGA05801.1 hypothetical protein GCM10011408_28440 [Dyella caseinilytica]